MNETYENILPVPSVGGVVTVVDSPVLVLPVSVVPSVGGVVTVVDSPVPVVAVVPSVGGVDDVVSNVPVDPVETVAVPSVGVVSVAVAVDSGTEN